MKATSRRNLFIVGGVLIVLGAFMTLTDYELPSDMASFTDLGNLVLVVRTLGVAAGIVCLVIAFIDLFRSRAKDKAE
jgi:hypothetical protein